MIDRRAFLRRLGVTFAAVAVAPSVLASLAERSVPATTDWNDWPCGLIDCVTSTSVHGLNASVVHGWNVALR